MQNFEPTGAAAAMPGSAVPQIKRRLVISACLLIPLFYLGLGAAFGLPLPPFLTGDNAMWCGIVQLVLTVPVCWLNRSYFINGCKSIRAPGPDTLVALSSGATSTTPQPPKRRAATPTAPLHWPPGLRHNRHFYTGCPAGAVPALCRRYFDLCRSLSAAGSTV